jgi:pilus assembly protein CpaE
MKSLQVLAVARNEEAVRLLQSQLDALDYVQCTGIVTELADAQRLWQQSKPDLLIMDLTERELDACLFIEVINYNVDSKTVVFGLHQELDSNVIVKAVSSGVKEFIQYPQNQAALSLAIEKQWQFLKKKFENQQSQTEALSVNSSGPSCQIISVFGAKGGVGTTTVAANLAHQLYLTTQDKVVLFDPEQMFSNMATMLAMKSAYSLSDLANDEPTEIDDALFEKIMVHHPEGFDVLVSCKNVLDENPLVSGELLERTFAYLKSQYQYIVIDCPTHTVDPYHQYFMEQASSVLLVSTLDIPALSRTRQYLDLIKRHLDMNKVKLIENRSTLKAVIGLSNEMMEQEFQHPVFWRLPNDWTMAMECMSLGKLLGEVNNNCDITKAYNQLARQLSGKPPMLLSKASPSEGSVASENLFFKLAKRAHLL